MDGRMKKSYPQTIHLIVVISEPKFIKAFFEYELFNEVVGKWKIKKREDNSSNKNQESYDVKSIDH